MDHSYEDDYFMISEVLVKIKDVSEKERIKKLVEKNRVEGSFVDPDRGLRKRIANLLEVDANIIDIDTNEIDLM